MKLKRKWKPLEVVIFAAPVIVLGVILLPGKLLPRWGRIVEGIPIIGYRIGNSKRVSCQNNLKQVSLAVLQYTRDYDELYPLAQFKGSSSVGWADVLIPYQRSIQLYQCPAEGGDSSGNPRLSNYTDYWFNSNLAGRSQAAVVSPASTLMFGDGNDGTDITDARYSKSGLPAGWLSDKDSPLYRHLGGANYAYADGHVKWSQPHAIGNTSPRAGWPTFAIK
jgi:prepilin-type processing-associated H-X9-DG protein